MLGKAGYRCDACRAYREEDPRFCPIADKYWNARGGSSSDGGAFTFTLKDSGKGDGSKVLVTENKFGEIVKTPENEAAF